RRLEQDEPIEVGLQDPRILYLDLETQKSAQEVGGWQNSHLMRVSVVVVYDTKDETYYYYDETNMEKLFSHLKEADLVVGFNIKGFDYKVLGAYLTALDEIPTFDILESVFSSLGFRLSLDHLAEETLNVAKQADGLQAIQWFRQGEMDKLREYCKQDVEITKALFLHGLEKGFLVYREKTNGRRLRLLVDWDLNSMLMKK
ncbi:MAG TPA: DEAD/DEAH box helicase, partial [Desulfobacterales bacterium]|nr:DEAD/DEAH box helicase [Desulfobacterales bacterium]